MAIRFVAPCELLSWLGAKLAHEGLRSPIVMDPAFLQAMLAGHPQRANIGVLSPDGQVLASAYPLASYRSWNDNPAYMAALRSENVEAGTYLISPIFERPTLNHAYAVRDVDGSVKAAPFSGLDLVLALREAIGTMYHQIDTAVDFVRRISSDLRPGVLDKLGLTAALEWLARELETRNNLIIEVEADNVDAAFHELLSVTLFRITQEC